MAGFTDQPEEEADADKQNNSNNDQNKQILTQITRRGKEISEDREQNHQKQDNQQQVKCNLSQEFLRIRRHKKPDRLKIGTSTRWRTTSSPPCIPHPLPSPALYIDILQTLDIV